MSVFFTSDQHYGHKNIIQYAKRPFASVEEMDACLIANYKARVRPGDLVYFVGDFAFCPASRAVAIVEQLPGQKYLVFGNHDRKLRHHNEFTRNFIWCKDLAEIKVGDQNLTLCHYALRVWNKSHYGAWHLYGHSHGSLSEDPHSLSFDVGVDPNHYYPVSFEEVAARMAKKNFVPIDRHGKEDDE